jgi:restriction endonuclease Mrr
MGLAQAAPKLNAQQVVKDIRDGCDDDALMATYGLSPAQLEKLFNKLLDLWLLSPSELVARVRFDDKSR